MSAVLPPVLVVLDKARSTPGLRIGEFTLRSGPTGGVWIERENGEGGEFKSAALADSIRQFYNDNF